MVSALVTDMIQQGRLLDHHITITTEITLRIHVLPVGEFTRKFLNA